MTFWRLCSVSAAQVSRTRYIVWKGKHAIKAERGLILIKDVEKLKELASPIYGIAEKEYDQHIRHDWRY